MRPGIWEGTHDLPDLVVSHFICPDGPVVDKHAAADLFGDEEHKCCTPAGSARGKATDTSEAGPNDANGVEDEMWCTRAHKEKVIKSFNNSNT